MQNDPIRATAEGMPAHPCGGLPAEQLQQIEQRYAFERLVHRWRTAEVGLGPDASTEQQKAWEERDADRVRFARDVLHFPTPSGHLCCLRDKLDVLIAVASTVGEDMAPFERVVLEGVLALRADIVNHGG